MLRPSIFLSVLLAATAISQAQTGFTTKTYPAVDAATTIEVADFNHDGHPDLLAYTTYGNGGEVYMNDGSGGFKPGVFLPSNGIYGSIFHARPVDLKGDGYPDIVACTVQEGKTSGQDYLVVFQNDGTGNFTIGQTIPIVAGCDTLTVGDVNLDGHLDIVTGGYSETFSGSNPTYNNQFATYFGDGTGKLGTPVVTSNVNLDIPSTSGDTNCYANNITGGNFYLDNQFSLIVNSRCGTSTSTPHGTTFLAHGDGTGHFTFTQSYAPVGYLADGHTFDLNVDGRPDGLFINTVAINGNTNLTTAINNGGGNFTYKSLFNTPGYTGVTAADFNGDGIPDLAASSISTAANNSQNSGPVQISIYNGSKAGTYTEAQSFTIGSTTTQSGDIVSADFNGDGKPDLATIVTDSNNVYTLYVYTNTLGSAAACSAPTTTNTNTICAPARGSTVTSPFTVTAASNVTGFTANRLYLDNVAVFTGYSQSVSTPITASPGSHNLVLVSYDNTGKAFSYSTTFTVGAGSGCLPSAPGVNICAPAQGASTTSPVTITAGALAQSGNITAIRAYIDNNPVLTVNNPSASKSFQISQPVTIATGSHHLVVVGYQSTGGTVVRGGDFTVSGPASCAPSGTGAMICSPGTNATVGSPVTILAGATTSSGYMAAVRIYVDNVAKDTVTNPQQNKSQSVSTSVSLAAGSHDIVVVGYPSTGGYVTARDTVTVQ